MKKLFLVAGFALAMNAFAAEPPAAGEAKPAEKSAKKHEKKEKKETKTTETKTETKTDDAAKN